MSILRTYSGIEFDLKNFDAGNISIVDIAHALSNSCRFNGHSKKFYSVAEHCVRCSRLSVDDATISHILLHDASEAYMGDVVTPLKRMMPWYEEKENQLIALIFDKYCVLPYTDYVDSELHFVDKLMFKIEADELWSDVTYFGWTPEKAKMEFLKSFYALQEKKLIKETNQ